MEIVFFIAGIVAFVVFLDARNWRNQEIAAFGQSTVSPGLWAFGVFMLMIVFLPMYLIERSSAKGRLLRACPWCHQRISTRMTICPFCQREVGVGAGAIAMTAGPAIPASHTIGVAPGWFPDPTGEHELRYWDGVRWTSHVHDQPRPPGGGAPASE